MSRHTFAGKANTTVSIGWDRPLGSFFVQVTKPNPEEEGETEMLVWLGTIFGELPTAAAAIAVAVSYADLPDTVGAMLETDRLKTVAMTDGPAQISARSFLKRS